MRLVMNDGGLELLAVTQDVGQAHEQIDAGYEGSELTVAFNPEYLMDGIEVTPGDEITLETVDALKPAVLRVGRTRGLPLPADAGSGQLSRPSVHVAELWLTDIRSYATAHVGVRLGPHGRAGCQRHREDQPASRRWRTWGRSGRFAASPPDTMVRHGRGAGHRRGRVQHDERTLLVECEIAGRGRSRAQINGQKVSRGRDLLEVLRSRVFAPDDLAIVKAGPALRRRFLDDVMVARSSRSSMPCEPRSRRSSGSATPS